MGIWPPGSDGTDINSVDVSRDSELVVTSGDNGEIFVLKKIYFSLFIFCFTILFRESYYFQLSLRCRLRSWQSE